jgi:hypothetical protein
MELVAVSTAEEQVITAVMGWMAGFCLLFKAHGLLFLDSGILELNIGWNNNSL